MGTAAAWTPDGWVMFDEETEREIGPVWEDSQELADFLEWHETGEQRSVAETFDDGDLEPQIAWWRDGGHLRTLLQ